MDILDWGRPGFFKCKHEFESDGGQCTRCGKTWIEIHDKPRITPFKGEEKIEPGYIYAPYKVVNVATYINSEMVWHRNWFINTGLKIRRLFKKKNPAYKKYAERTINPKYYGKVEIGKNHNSSLKGT